MSHEKGIEAAQDKIYDVVSVDYGGLSRDSDAALQIVKAYLDASGMVMVPREPTPRMVIAGNEAMPDGVVFSLEPGEGIDDYDGRPVYQAMVFAAPNPFQTPEESRESSGRS